MTENKEVKVDTDLYSRSIFTYGLETLKKLSTMKILIIGMRGLGVETAKNIILSGPGEVDIFDPTIVTIRDLGSNFFLSESDVGKKNRDEACIEKLAQLNPNVKVGIMKDEKKDNIDEYIKIFCQKIEKYNVVVFTELHPMYFIDKIDKFCREKNIKFIYGMCLGLAGYVFTDFGPEHIILDETGEELGTYLVKNITKDKEGLVTIDTIQGTNKLKIGDGDWVTFKNVEGMTELNGKEFQIIFEDYQSFKIGDTSKFGEYTKGGVINQIRKPKKMIYYQFFDRASMICDPYHPLVTADNTKEGRAELLYMALSGVHDFYMQNNCTLPEINNMDQAKKIKDNVKIMYDQAKEKKYPCYNNIQKFDEKIVINVARWASVHVTPVCAFFGGIIAQEIIKATGKYIPIDQWVMYDFFESIENLGDNIDRTLKNCRYDDQIAIFGNEIQQKIQNSNMFMVGAGATGCEFIKNFAMMGFCTSDNKKFLVTDNDNIEVSNLNRQFLFRKKDVGKPKSTIAVKSVMDMNPSFKAKGLQLKVCKETEDVFNEEFWSSQDFIIYAVDSVEARKYIDEKVIFHQKIAADSGTLGTQAQSQIIIPFKTITYKDRAPSEITLEIPQCTLRHFPSMIQHCIEWSKNQFGEYFGPTLNDVKKFFTDYDAFKNLIKGEGSPTYQLIKLKYLKQQIDIFVTQDIKKMCEFGIDCYTSNFDHGIQQLLYVYPPDHKTIVNDVVQDFWTGSKRLPHPIKFNPKDDLCLSYVLKFVQILSHAFGINLTKEQLSKENIKNICAEINIPDFVKKENVKIEINDEKEKKEEKKEECLYQETEEMKKEQEEAQKKIDEIMKELDKIKRENYDVNKIIPEEFEKDHDENGHVDFIHAGANLRARNYNIDECDRNKTKKISGKIIPTVLTTTASIAAIVSLQFYTTFITNDPKYFREGYFNLSANSFYFAPPHDAIKTEDKSPDALNGAFKAIPNGWTSWDKIEIKGSKTCGEFCEILKKEYGINVDTIFIDELMIYDSFLPIKINKDLKIEDVYATSIKKEISDKKRFLPIHIVATVSDVKINGKEYKSANVLTPPIKYMFREK